MNPSTVRFIDSRGTLVVVVALFCAGANLSIYSSDQIAMTLGTHPQNVFESASHFLMVAFQPWLYLLYWVLGIFHLFGPHRTISSSLLTALISGAVLFSLLRVVSRRFACTARVILGLLLFCAFVEAYSFALDMQRLRGIDESYTGP